MVLTNFTQAQVAAVQWQPHPANPLIGPPFPSPIIADPTVLLPHETPDNRWHLWAHSLRGVHHYTSSDGLAWQREPSVVVPRALRPFVRPMPNGSYYIYYERHTRLHPFRSHIEVRRSTDLRHWSAPQTALAPSLPWHHEPQRHRAVSNPGVVPLPDGRFRLYYSASLVWLPDCRFWEPRYIGAAHSASPAGPFVPDAQPIIRPTAQLPYLNLGAGALKVLPCADGYVAFWNTIYHDDSPQRHTRSAIYQMAGTTGLDFDPATARLIRAPQGNGWERSHIYALDVRALPDGTWRLYYNARNGWSGLNPWNRERIGLLTATAPSAHSPV